MEEIKQRRLKFLEDTVKYYSEDTNRRAVDKKGFCRYKLPNGNKCAIGRHIPNSKYSQSLEGLTCNSNTIMSCLPENIKELSTLFLISVQNLHDERRYWGNNELSFSGLVRVERIKQDYCV